MPKSVTDIHVTMNDLTLTMISDKIVRLFPEFSQIFSILTDKLFKDVCVPDLPVSTQRTRQTVTVSTTPEVVEFLLKHLTNYNLYLTDLYDNINSRFTCKTFW